MTATDKAIVPFGKYKGRLIEELLVDDPNYLEWLSGQDWFRAKYINLHQVIINRGAEPEETPEHNALQVLFLEDEFCRRFLQRMPDWKEMFSQAIESINERRKWELAAKQEALQNGGYRSGSDDWYRYGSKFDQAKVEAEVVALSDPGAVVQSFSRRFEVKGVDVVLSLMLSYERVSDIFEQVRFLISEHRCYERDIRIEIKPVVADDYPAVLRQMKANGSRVLFLERYAGKGATRDQFIKTFATAGRVVIFKDEVQ